MHRYRTGGRLADDDTAWLTLLLAHLPVRDSAWERTDGEQWHLDLWTDVLRRAEPDLVPAPASLLTFAAWRAGQGALAAVALDRALDAQPDYSMALLLAELLAGGVQPSKMDGWPRIGPSGAGRRGGGRADPGDGRPGRRAAGRGNGPGSDCDGPGRRPRHRGSARRGVSDRGAGRRRGGPRCQ
jgi:hypothetical protein